MADEEGEDVEKEEVGVDGLEGVDSTGLVEDVISEVGVVSDVFGCEGQLDLEGGEDEPVGVGHQDVVH